MTTGDRLTLTIDKPAAGGRMIARHDGAIVLVSAAIPGETVEATIEKVQRGTAWARTTRVVDGSADRIQPDGDWSCGGCVFAHVRYERQLALKAEIIRDAFTRIARLSAPESLTVFRSPVDGYRMRARLHVAQGRIGFFREGTHEICEPASTRQLLPTTLAALTELATALQAVPDANVVEVEISESAPADQRVFHLELAGGADPAGLETVPRLSGVTGLSIGDSSHDHPGVPATRGVRGGVEFLTLWGSPIVTDTISVPAASGRYSVTTARHARSFFQGNRFLLPDLMGAVVDAVPPGRVLDLYAGVGLFSTALAVLGDRDVVAIEGDHASALDLQKNAARAGGTITTRHASVEAFLGTQRPSKIQTVIVDPPRSGMSKSALTGALRLGAGRMVYVSCDVATLARDARTIVDAGYRLTSTVAFDLFPNTAHVESVVVFDQY